MKSESQVALESMAIALNRVAAGHARRRLLKMARCISFGRTGTWPSRTPRPARTGCGSIFGIEEHLER